MPLPELARKYADEMYAAQVDKVSRDLQAQRVETRSQYAMRGGVNSSNYVMAEVKIHGDAIRSLLQARADTLVRAYERVGAPFDDGTLREITDEVQKLGAIQQRHTISALVQIVIQTWGGNPPPDMQKAMTSQVESDVSSILGDVTRNLRIRRYEAAIDEQKLRSAYAAGLGKRWDVFISHASEDKDSFVRPLADALEKTGLQVWYDETTLKVGDSLRRAIDHGLSNSRYGIVVLSHSFFAKPWPQNELDGLFAMEVRGVKVILPVWHNVAKDDVSRYSPILAGRLAANSGDGIETVVRQLRDAMGS